MAPIKFEDNLKEKLEQRKLQPSITAWKTLQERLDANNDNKSNKTFWWLGIAASFVGILIITTVFFNKSIQQTAEPILVDIEDVNIQNTDNNNLNKLVQEVAVEELKIEKVLPKSNANTLNKKPILQKLQQKEKLIIIDIKEAIVQTDIKEEEQITEKANVTKALTFEDIKLQEVVAQIQDLKKNNQTVSDIDIDALLDQAQKEIALKKLYSESTKTVDADALLQDVEADLEQSFRDRVFKALKAGYKEVRTAVAERNN